MNFQIVVYRFLSQLSKTKVLSKCCCICFHHTWIVTEKRIRIRLSLSSTEAYL